MKKIIWLLALPVVAFCMCKQQPESTNLTNPPKASEPKILEDPNGHAYTDAKGLRQGYWIILNRDIKPPLPGYSPDAKVEEGNYRDDKRFGPWIEYLPDGKIKSKIQYKNDSVISTEEMNK